MKNIKINNSLISYIIGFIIITSMGTYFAHSYIEIQKRYNDSLIENTTLKNEINEKSEIEKISSEIKVLNNEAEKLKKVEMESKKNYELSIWKVRCLEKNVILEVQEKQLEDCNNNLERFASYNLK